MNTNLKSLILLFFNLNSIINDVYISDMGEISKLLNTNKVLISENNFKKISDNSISLGLPLI